MKRKKDTFNMTGFCRKVNEMNLQLRGNLITLIDSERVITTFIEKLDLIRQNILRRRFHQFPELAAINEIILMEDIKLFGEHLNMLKCDMTNRFTDAITLKVDPLMANPFLFRAADVEVAYQEEITELRNDEISRTYFNEGEY